MGTGYVGGELTGVCSGVGGLFICWWQALFWCWLARVFVLVLALVFVVAVRLYGVGFSYFFCVCGQDFCVKGSLVHSLCSSLQV